MATHDSDDELDALIAGSAVSTLPPLPSLLATPNVYPGCCVALSIPLLDSLRDALPAAPELILSIGSGSGLIEALLLVAPYSLDVIGVEVQPSVNRHLPHSRHREVMGTYSLHQLADKAKAWLFVYPRSPALVETYLKTHGNGAVEMVVWIGPMADWDDYKGCFAQGWKTQVRSADELGGRAWETVGIATKASDAR